MSTRLLVPNRLDPHLTPTTMAGNHRATNMELNGCLSWLQKENEDLKIAAHDQRAREVALVRRNDEQRASLLASQQENARLREAAARQAADTERLRRELGDALARLRELEGGAPPSAADPGTGISALESENMRLKSELHLLRERIREERGLGRDRIEALLHGEECASSPARDAPEEEQKQQEPEDDDLRGAFARSARSLSLRMQWRPRGMTSKSPTRARSTFHESFRRTRAAAGPNPCQVVNLHDLGAADPARARWGW